MYYYFSKVAICGIKLFRKPKFYFSFAERKTFTWKWWGKRKDDFEAYYIFPELENWYIPMAFLYGFCSFYLGGWFLILAFIAGIVFFFLGNCLNFISFGYAAQVRFPWCHWDFLFSNILCSFMIVCSSLVLLLFGWM